MLCHVLVCGGHPPSTCRTSRVENRGIFLLGVCLERLENAGHVDDRYGHDDHDDHVTLVWGRRGASGGCRLSLAANTPAVVVDIE